MPSVRGLVLVQGAWSPPVFRIKPLHMIAELLLSSAPLFEGLGPEDLASLAKHINERHVRAGEIIFRMGDSGGTMYILVKGQVNIHLPGEASFRVSLQDLGEGECFGELALFDNKPRSASACATTDAVLLELSRETLSNCLMQRPSAAIPILRVMAERLRQTNTLLSQRAARNAVQEIEQNLSWSDRLADRVATSNGSWFFITGLLGLTVLWVLCNRAGLLRTTPFDPYPFVFYNLVLAILGSLQGPLIVMSQNRQAIMDRKSAEVDFQVNLKNEVNIETIVRDLSEFRRETNERLRAFETHDGRNPHSV